MDATEHNATLHLCVYAQTNLGSSMTQMCPNQTFKAFEIS